MAIAMGLQNATVRRLAVPDLTTSVLMLTLTGIFADGAWLGGPGSKAGRRTVSVAAMFVGALGGALLLLHISQTAALAASLGVLAAVLAGLLTVSRSPADWAKP